MTIAKPGSGLENHDLSSHRRSTTSTPNLLGDRSQGGIGLQIYRGRICVSLLYSRQSCHLRWRNSTIETDQDREQEREREGGTERNVARTQKRGLRSSSLITMSGSLGTASRPQNLYRVATAVDRRVGGIEQAARGGKVLSATTRALKPESEVTT